MEYKITVLPGDGIGPDIVGETVKVLDAVAKKSWAYMVYVINLWGHCLCKTGNPLPEETMRSALASDAVLLGAVGGPKWDGLKGDVRPEAALLGIRKGLGLFANIRPARIYPALSAACPLKPEIIGDNGLDIVIVRELTGGIYFGPRGRKTENGVESAWDTMLYNENEVRRIAHVAFHGGKKETQACH